MFRFFKNGFLNIRLKNLSYSNQAVVGIVVAVMLIGLFVTVLSIIQLVYVPNWMEEIESEHIDEVFNQFSQLKLVIDTQSAINDPFTPIVTSINLGTNKIPFFMSMQAAGELDIIADACIVNISNLTNLTYFTTNYSLGAIRFTSVNAYYIPEERISFIYENGALITNQTKNNSLNIKPFFKYNQSSNTIYFNIVNISGVGSKISMYSYNTEHIRTELNYKDNKTIRDVEFLNITTNHHYIWKSFIDASLKDGGLEKGIDYDILVDGNKISIHFTNLLDIELKYTCIYAQIGPGWIDV